MSPLQEIFQDNIRFAYGVELVTTRGTMDERKARHTRAFARELVDKSDIDWVSITDNAGGNPQLSPLALGKPILYAGKEVIIHLSCKDFNRNGLESTAWHLASEGFKNILALTGDYPISGYSGHSKPVFDIDSIGLLTLLNEMNNGLGIPLHNPKTNAPKSLKKTEFYLGAVVTNFKLHERETIPQYLKLQKKVEVGAQFIISQIGFDAAKYSEMIAYMQNLGMGNIPLIGNVFLMNARLANFFNKGKIPGVVVSDSLVRACEKANKSPDKGKGYFLELAAKQTAIFKGLGYRGAYFGGIEEIEELEKIIKLSNTYSQDDWKEFAKEIQYSRPGEFFYYAVDPDTGLSIPNQLDPAYEASLQYRKPSHNITTSFRINKWFHDKIFAEESPFFNLGKHVYENAKNPEQGPTILRKIEHLTKAAMFQCKDCGDCSLPDAGYLCPESSCVKNQRNGPCGGTRDGKCEIENFECIWARTYDRLKFEGKEKNMLDHAPVIQDQSLRGTSSWSNTFRKLDHHANNTHKTKFKKQTQPSQEKTKAIQNQQKPTLAC